MKNKISNEKIILSYSGVCGIIASFPIPFWDIVVILPFQILMGTKIANGYGIEVTKQEMKDIVMQIFGVIGMGFLAQQLIIRVVYKLIPFYGSITTIPIVFAFSYAIGKIMDKYFLYKTEGKEISAQEIKDTFFGAYEYMKETAKKLGAKKIQSYGEELKNEEEVQKEMSKFKKK